MCIGEVGLVGVLVAGEELVGIVGIVGSGIFLPQAAEESKQATISSKAMNFAIIFIVYNPFRCVTLHR